MKVSFPAPDVIRIVSAKLFGQPDAEPCRRFIGRVLLARQIDEAIIVEKGAPAVDLEFDALRHSRKAILRDVADLLEGRIIENDELEVASMASVRDHRGVIRYRRIGNRASGWRIERRQPGFLRVTNPVLYRKGAFCQVIERELMSVLGVHHYDTSPTKCRVDIEYDPRQIAIPQLIELLDDALAGAAAPRRLDKLDHDLAVCSVSVPVAAAAQLAVPSLLPVSAALFLYTTLPSFKGAWRVVTKERRFGVDILDSVVILACVGTMEVLPGAILAWCLSFGRSLVRRTEDNSRKLLVGAFGKQPRFCWLLKDGQEIQISLDKLQAGDVVVVNTGEAVPVDGIVTHGLAVIDQHALTGESTPAEKGIGDQVFASTLMLAGRIHVAVEKSGGETATAKIATILNDTAGYKLASQHHGEQLADRAVVPTLAVGGVALATIGAQGATAVLNSDMGTGIRIAAPLAMLSTLALCAQRGVLVKDGRALDLLREVDTVLFDKTGTLTRERPEVGRIVATNGHTEERVLRYAAAAEQRFHHPIAQALLQCAADSGLDLPEADNTQYRVGYGITVGLEGRIVRVGSRRFMEVEGIYLTPDVEVMLEEAHREGHTVVLVAVDDDLGGALELRTSLRPEVPQIIKGLRARGIKHLAIISGDHEAPTRRLAEEIGMDRYFAQVLPADKASYVEQLQREGRKVCFVGDGINDAIALKKANVSISLRGATSIATDTAHVVFMEPSLGKLCELHDIARDLDRNVSVSWGLILVPNIACVVGVFTLGFGIGMSVLTNNVASLAALANGLWPMRKVAAHHAQRRRMIEVQVREDAGQSSRRPRTER